VRAGAHALALLSTPLNLQIIEAVEQKSLPPMDLRRATGSPPQTTMRSRLRALTEEGLLEKRRFKTFPSSVEYGLGQPGHAILPLRDRLRDWLRAAPSAPVELGSTAGKSAIKALGDGWSSTIIRALAARSFSLTELNRLIPDISYPSLERRLLAMRMAEQIEGRPAVGRGTPYRVTPWLRQAVPVLAAAALWDQGFGHGKTEPVSRLEVEALFLLALPTIRLATELSGICGLEVELEGRDGERRRRAGAVVEFCDGQMTWCSSRVDESVPTSVTGSAEAWLRALGGTDGVGLRVRGDDDLAAELTASLRGEAPENGRSQAAVADVLSRLS
jgi:DNA-binding HxlR family transcriptional regulator